MDELEGSGGINAGLLKKFHFDHCKLDEKENTGPAKGRMLSLIKHCMLCRAVRSGSVWSIS
jgi:hypothetical protein